MAVHTAIGSRVRGYRRTDIRATGGVALRECEASPGHGTADDLLRAEARRRA